MSATHARTILDGEDVLAVGLDVHVVVVARQVNHGHRLLCQVHGRLHAPEGAVGWCRLLRNRQVVGLDELVAQSGGVSEFSRLTGLSEMTRRLWGVLLILILPLSVLALGGSIIVSRRRA